jgi:hypothetical protein
MPSINMMACEHVYRHDGIFKDWSGGGSRRAVCLLPGR